MTPGDWIAAGSAMFTAAVAGAGALYLRGKLDGLQAAMERRLAALEARARADEAARQDQALARGAQRLRNRMIDAWPGRRAGRGCSWAGWRPGSSGTRPSASAASRPSSRGSSASTAGWSS